MAFLDRARNAIVLRVVYDGPAGAGKTTSVRALGRSLGRPVTTPEEAGERTLFFDWLDYTGGYFDGRPLRCQVVTVPGQSLLGHRRRALLETADVIVVVAPVSAASLPALLDALAQLPTELDGTPIGVVLQANKRDLPDAIPVADLRASLAAAGRAVQVVETTASAGDGVREAFVFAIRLALDRVREQASAGTLERARPIDDPASLYERMRAEENDRSDAPVLPPAPSEAPLLERLGLEPEPPVARGAAAAADEDACPLAPDQTVPAGLVWPPIDGRVQLAEATAIAPAIARVAGGWSGTTEDGWRLHSPARAVYDDLEGGREALVRWARLHAQHQRMLSTPRCIALASDGQGRWRLWQVLRMRPSLRDRLAASLDERDPASVAEVLVDATVRLSAMHERMRAAPAALELSLDTIGVWARETSYVGLVPNSAMPLEALDALVARLLGPILRDWTHVGDEVARALGRLRFRAQDPITRDACGQLLSLAEGGEGAGAG